MKLRELFDQCAEDYDRDRPKLVPDFAGLYGTALRVIPFARGQAISVLDLGAGTGLLGAMVAQAFPGASLDLTDISEAMLTLAQERFADNPKVRCLVQEHSLLAAIDEYDLVVSALSIHHLTDDDKQSLFSKIHRALKPGGIFVNIDQARAPSVAAEEAYERFWREDARAAGVSEAALAQAMERMREDNNALLADQLLWLTQAGFSQVDCWYKRFRFVVYGGEKMAIPCNGCGKEMGADNVADADSFSGSLEEINGPVLLMQGNPRQVVTANRQALDLFGKEACEVEGHRGGEVFDCVHSFTETGCGKDVNCEGCPIKDAVVDTFTSGSPHQGVVATLQVKKAGGNEHRLVQVSTEKTGKLALVRVERYDRTDEN